MASHPQTTSSCPAANGGDDVLPPDVLFDVLLRLPAIMLLGHPRAVCRSWRSLLSDPLFLAAHAAHHPDRLLAVSTRAIFDEKADVELLATPSGRVARRVVRCAGPSYPWNPPMRAHLGLVLVARDNWKGQRLRVEDAATGAVSVLPQPYRRETIADSFSVLGRASEEEGEYKVLTITVDLHLVQSCKVLTLGGGVWREAQKPPAMVKCHEPWVAAVAKGVVHILAFHRLEQSDWIAAFDLGTEQWRPGLLRGPLARSAVSSLTEMDGRLVAVTGSFASSSVHLWLLVGCSDRGGGDELALWHPVCTVQMSRIRRHSYEQVEEPLWVLNSGRVAFVVWSPVQGRRPGMVDGGGERGCQNWVLRVYDPRTKCFEDVAHLSSPTDVAIGVCIRHPNLEI
ncbi:unnamed protein product [Urochloa humidicola]